MEMNNNRWICELAFSSRILRVFVCFFRNQLSLLCPKRLYLFCLLAFISFVYHVLVFVYELACLRARACVCMCVCVCEALNFFFWHKENTEQIWPAHGSLRLI